MEKELEETYLTESHLELVNLMSENCYLFLLNNPKEQGFIY